MSTTIESLELEIKSNAESAAQGIDVLTQSLEKLGKMSEKLGLSGVAKDTKKLATALSKMEDTNSKVSGSFTDLSHALKSVANGVKKVGTAIYSAVEKSMDYTENMNLFSVAMGEYADGAYEYAEKVSDAMGIDTSEWIRAQGVFMTLATGFGVASDRADIMSRNLTQLGYDLSSFYNIDVEDAMLKLQSGLSGELEPLRRLGYDLSQAKLEATALALGIDKSVSSMTQAEKAQLRYYAIMTQVTETHGDMARTLEAPANQMRVFKAQVNMAAREIGNIFIPALNAILPYAISVAKVIRILASEIASLFGYTAPEVDYSGVEAMSTAATDTGDALDDATDSAKKLKSYMLGFDELNVINPNTEAASMDTSDIFGFELPEYDFLGGLVDTKVSNIVKDMKEWLGITEDIESWSDLLSTNFGNILVSVGLIGVGLAAWKISTIATAIAKMRKDTAKMKALTSGLGVFFKAMGIAAVSLAAIAGASWLVDNTESTVTKIGAIISGASLVVGSILAFTGINLPLGIGLMVAGAVSMGTAIALNTDKLSDEVKNVVAMIAGVVSGALLVVGAILAFTGANIPLGIALIAGGALTLGTAIAPNWNSLSDSTQEVITTIMEAVGGALLALGAILAFSGANIPLGIGLMVSGAVSLGSAIALNWESLSTDIKGAVSTLTAIVGGALLAVGAILAFTGANIPLGIGLIASGAVSLGSAIALNWESLSNDVKNVIAVITATVSGSLLAAGAILAFTGANIPLGIALMAGGALTLGTAIAPNWNSLSDSVQEIITGIMGMVGGASLALGAILAFTGANIPLGIGLMAVGALSLGGAIALNWESMSGDIEGVVTTLTTIVGGALLALGAVLAFTGANIPLGIGLMAGGALTLGSSIAMNTNLLSDDVKEVVAVITSAVSLALLAVGAILAFTGANIPLGIGLMASGALALGGSVIPNWSSLSESVQETISIIMAAVGGALLVLGAILAFSGANIPLGIGFMLVGAASLGTALALNWDSVVDALRGPVGGIVALLSGALLVLGAILLFTGVGIPLGIGLMVAGAAGLATVATVNWNFLSDKIAEIWNTIKTFWNTYIAPVFTAQWWTDLGKTCINGLISGFEGGINGIIGAFESMINWIVDGLNSISFDIPGWLGGGSFGINLPRASFGRVSIPRLAEGGFPETGQMFIAREAGAEMVGSIGRRTAVANNDQIVSGIASGVAEANEEQNALLREQNSLLRALLDKESGVYLDGKYLTNSVEKHQRERGRVLITGGVL